MHTAPNTPTSLVPPQGGHWLGPLLLALLAHTLLVAALTWGISWQKDSLPLVAEAELWSRLPQSAASKAVDTAPAPEPAAEPSPTPAPSPPPPLAPEPNRQAAAAQARAEAQAQADIALQQHKKEQQRLQALRQQQAAEREKAQKEQALRDQAQKDKAEKAAQAKATQEKAAREKAAKEQAAREKAAQDKEKAQQLAREKAAQAKEEQRLQAQLTKERAANIQRIQGMAGASGPAGSTGTAQQSSGPSASYAGRVVAAVRPNIVFTDNLSTNPTAEVEVHTLPDGTVASRRIVKSSGIPNWDDAVLKALDRTAKLPLDVGGRVYNPLIIEFRPKE